MDTHQDTEEICLKMWRGGAERLETKDKQEVTDEVRRCDDEDMEESVTALVQFELKLHSIILFVCWLDLKV